MENFDLTDEKLDNFNPKDLIHNGIKHAQNGNIEEALRLFDLYLSIDPWDANAINNKADCFLRLNRQDEALELEYYALTLNPKFAIGWCTLSEIQAFANEKFCARLNLELSMDLTPKDSPLYSMLEENLKELDEGKVMTAIRVADPL
jgi:tetratricopeptide (TPR) repeat protein